MRLLKLIFYPALLFLGVSFAVLNATPVQVNFYIATKIIPVALLIAGALGMGMLIGFLLFLGRYLRLKSQYRRVKNQLHLTEKEIKNLRSIPLQDQH